MNLVSSYGILASVSLATASLKWSAGEGGGCYVSIIGIECLD